MTASVQVVVDYTAGLADGEAGIRVVAPDAAKRQFGDPPSRQEYLAAFLDLVPRSPLPVICLVGPYGYSAAFTAAAAARNELGRHKVDANSVHVLNTGRSFLGLGALALAIARSGAAPEEARAWLNDAAPAAGCWVVAETAALAALGHEWQVEAPKGLPTDPFTLLRVRLTSRVLGGFATAEACGAAAVALAPAGGTRLAWGASPSGWMPAIFAGHAALALGAQAAFASSPAFTRGATNA